MNTYQWVVGRRGGRVVSLAFLPAKVATTAAAHMNQTGNGVTVYTVEDDRPADS